MFSNIQTVIENISNQTSAITNRKDLPFYDEDKEEAMKDLIAYIQSKVSNNEEIRLNFICTHNSRRSHLSQIWAQTMAFHFGITNVFCYSGGTEATAMFSKVVETLTNQGFQISPVISDEENKNKNVIYAVKYAANEPALVCFSKTYNNSFNPASKYGAIMTCSSADQGCPVVRGSEARFPVRYNDPKAFDNTDQMDAKYLERSLEIASDMYYIFSQIKAATI